MDNSAESNRILRAALTVRLSTCRLTPCVLSMVLLLSACGVTPARPSAARSAGTSSGAAAPASAANPGDAAARFAAALALLDQHNDEQAESALMALNRDYPQASGPSTELGLLYLRSNRKPQALQSFETAVKTNPQNAVALNCLGILYRQRGDFARAEQSYLRAISARPDDARAHLNLGILYELSMHRPQDALVQYRESQKVAAKENLMVTAWIRELEPATAVAVAAPPESLTTTQAAR